MSGQCLALFSGKGGVGRTLLTAAFGAHLASEGKRVALVDLNTGMRGLDMALGVESRVAFDLGDVLDGLCSARQALVKAPGEMRLLAARQVRDSETLENELRRATQEACKDGKAALALSGGIDSAALARFMPKGSTAYTFRCVVPGMQVTDESPGAARYAEACGLKHKIIDIYWEDFEALTPKLMKRKGMPVHSIEIQIYKAALQAKRDGFERLIFGETADVIYGGLDGLLSKDWLAGDFIERFAFVPAWKVLRDARLVVKPMLAYERDGHIDPHEFISQFFIREVVTSYFNACCCADIEATLPYLGTYLDAPLDYARVRGGENKYLVREMFRRLYPGFVAPKKLPMPRATNEWFKDWKGPTRPEFLPHCTDNMTGDQKWLVYCLEMFLNLLDTNFAGSAG